MSKLTRDDVLKLARLARLELSEAEIKKFQTELSEILKYVEQLQGVDTSGLKPTTQVSGLTNVMRDDEVVDYGVSPADLLRIAPKTQDNHVKVNRMVG